MLFESVNQEPKSLNKNEQPPLAKPTRSTHVVKQLSFFKFLSILTFDFDSFWGHFLIFGAITGYFWGLGRVHTLFWGVLM